MEANEAVIYMSKLLVANWKAHPKTEAEAVALARASDMRGIVVCPPHEFVREVGMVLEYAALGAQDYAPDLAVVGAQYAIVGHSSRRSEGETDDIISEKIGLAAADGLIPILCVGETADSYTRHEADVIVRWQVASGLSRLNGNRDAALCIAYEPVWAISVNAGAHEATVEYTEARIARIREAVMHSGHRGVVTYLYGGSVTLANVGLFASSAAIDGLLVGGVSLQAEEIRKIWQQLQK